MSSTGPATTATSDDCASLLVGGAFLSYPRRRFAHVFDGFGVGLTIAPLGTDVGPSRRGERPSRLTDVLPVADWSSEQKALELTRIGRFRSMLDAYEAAVVVGLAADRPDALDPGPDHPGASRGRDARSPIPGTSEFFVEELAVVTNTSARVAGRLAAESCTLVEHVPEVWASLADGLLDRRRAQVFIDVLGPVQVQVARRVAEAVLPEAGELSTGRLRARLSKLLVQEDTAQAEQLRVARERQADVRLYPTAPGMSELAVELPAPVAAACWSTIDELAWMRKNDGDARPIGQLRALTHAELLLRPWDESRPPVTAVLTVTAPLPSLCPPVPAGDGERPVAQEAGEVGGQPITAAHVRELLTQLDAVCPGGLQPPTAGSLTVAVTDADGRLLATTTRPELERLARRGCLAHPDRVAAEPGELPAGRRCTVLDRPPAVDRYRPTPAQQRFTKTRARTCRQPGCGQPVGRVDLDHVRAHADGGPTDCDNLCCLCRRHHRLKTHAPGWRFVLLPHGVLRVTTPSGVTRSTRPPGLRDRIEQRALPAPPPPPVPTEEPPPF